MEISTLEQCRDSMSQDLARIKEELNKHIGDRKRSQNEFDVEFIGPIICLKTARTSWIAVYANAIIDIKQRLDKINAKYVEAIEVIMPREVLRRMHERSNNSAIYYDDMYNDYAAHKILARV